jgi:hypothetical protein
MAQYRTNWSWFEAANTPSVSSWEVYSATPNLLTVTQNIPNYDGDIEKIQNKIFAGAVKNRTLLIAGHVVARARSDGHLFDALCYPTFLMNDTALDIRDQLISALPLLDQQVQDGEVTPEHANKVREKAKLLLSDIGIMANYGAIAASSFLPPADMTRQLLTA